MYNTSRLQLVRNILLSTFKTLHNCQYMLSDLQMLVLPTLNDFLPLLCDFQLMFLPALNVGMFALHDILKAYNKAEGNGLHSTETTIALNMRLAYVCLPYML